LLLPLFRYWARCNVMSTDRVNYKVFRWAFRNAINKKKNWCFRIMTKFRECNLELYTDLENVLHKNVITQLEDFFLDKYKVNWHNRSFHKKLEINYELINCLKRFLKQRCI
jgi:hypothetical protein